MIDVNFFVAFTAGLVSFLAPCVVPLVPAYISYISGVSVTELAQSADPNRYRNRVLLNSLIYILGFSFVFVLLGLGVTAISRMIAINRAELIKFGGIFIIFFGLYSMGLFNRLRLAQKEFQFQLPQSVRSIKYLGPFLLGNTFALAWTPCVGAVYAAILTLAATSQNITQAAFLLFVYSLGISLPFLLAALTISSSYKLLLALGPKLQLISIIGGLLLVGIGLLMVTGRYDQFNGLVVQILGQAQNFCSTVKANF